MVQFRVAYGCVISSQSAFHCHFEQAQQVLNKSKISPLQTAVSGLPVEMTVKSMLSSSAKNCYHKSVLFEPCKKRKKCQIPIKTHISVVKAQNRQI